MLNKLIIISGANGNIGNKFAEYFLAQNKKVLMLYHSRNERVKLSKTKFPQNSFSAQIDLTDYLQVEKILLEIISEIGISPGYFIHTASVRSHDSQPLAASNPKVWQNIFESNINSAYNSLRVILPMMQQNRYGKIILFGSNVTRKGLPFGSAYAAAKTAIASIVRSVATEEAQNNILINTISPGPVKIDTSHFSKKYQQFRENYYNEQIKQIPLKRIAEWDDLIGLCQFLLSEKNKYITGEEFFVTGGNL